MSRYTLKDLREGQIVKLYLKSYNDRPHEYIYSSVIKIVNDQALLYVLASTEPDNNTGWTLDVSDDDGSVVVLDIIELELQERLKKEHPEEFV